MQERQDTRIAYQTAIEPIVTSEHLDRAAETLIAIETTIRE